MAHLALRARVVVCGTAAIEQWDPWPQGPRVERHLLVKRARMQGFVIFDHMDRYEDSVARLADWVRSGQLVYEEDVLERSEEHTSELQSLMRISYAVFCLKKKKKQQIHRSQTNIIHNVSETLN